MQMTKKVLSVVLAVLMVVSMMSVMAVSTATVASAATAKTVYFTKPGNWSGVNCYAWDENEAAVSAAWPGDAATFAYKNDYNEDVYSYSVPGTATGIIFNDGTNQTANITSFADYEQFYLDNGNVDSVQLVAKVGTKLYTSFADAVAAANGSLINVLVKDATPYVMSVGQSIVTDNYSKITIQAPAGAYAVHRTYDSTAKTYTFTVIDAVASYSDGTSTYYFDTLSSAISAVPNATTTNTGTYTVNLLQDSTESSINVGSVTAKKNVVIDLGGNTLTLNRNYTGLFLIRNGSNAEVKNGKVVFDTVNANASGFIVQESAASTLTLANTLEVEATGNTAGVFVNKGTLNCSADITTDNSFAICTNGSTTTDAVINVTGSTLTSNNVAVYLPGDADATFTDCTVTGSTAMYIKGGSVEINGGTYTGTANHSAYTYNGNGCNATGDAIVVENAGTTYTAGPATVVIADDATLAVTGDDTYALGAYTKNAADSVAVTLDDVDVPSVYADGNAAITLDNGATITNPIVPEDGYKVVEENGVQTVVACNYVCQIEGGAKFESLEDAFANANSGATITVLADTTLANVNISSGKTLTLDCADKTVTVDAWSFTNSGTLTVTGTTGGLTGTKGLVDNYGTLNIAGGVHSTTLTNPAFYNNYDGNVINVTGGTIDAAGTAIVNENGTTNISGGTINGAVYSKEDSTGTNNAADTINFTGGTISDTVVVQDADSTFNMSGDAAITRSVAGNAVEITAGTANLNGGTITCTGAANGVYIVGNDSDLNVDGATITNENNFCISSNGTAGNEGFDITITSGTFTSENDAAVFMPQAGTLTIDDGYFEGVEALYIKSGTVTINDGDFVSTADHTEFEHTGNGTKDTGDVIFVENCNYPGGAPVVTINGGTFTPQGEGTYAVAAYSYDDQRTEVTLDNVTVPSAYGVADSTFNLENGATITNITPAEGCTVETDADGNKTIVSNDVAEVNGVKYATFKEARNAVKTAGSGTIKILKDFELDGYYGIFGDCTIDLAGHTITGTNHMFQVQSGADLTIVGPGTLEAGDKTAVCVLNGGSLDVKDGAVIKGGTPIYNLGTTTITDGDITASGTGNTGIWNEGGATLTINGGKITVGENSWGVVVREQGTSVTMNGGEIVTGASSYGISGIGNPEDAGYSITVNGGKVKGGELGIYHPNDGTLVINGGEISGDTGVYVKSGDTQVTISGGTIKGTGTATAYNYNGNGGTPTGDALVVDNCGYPGGAPGVQISGGKFISDNAKPVGSYNTPKDGDATTQAPIQNFISGGSFNKAVDEDLCTVGYVPTTTVDPQTGMYTVELGNNPLDALVKDDANKVITSAAAQALDGNQFGLPGNLEYKNGAILGVQKKLDIATQNTDDGLRFVSVLSKDIYSDPEVTDYGYIFAKVNAGNDGISTKVFENKVGFDNLTEANGIKLSCKGTTNTVVGNGYGDPASGNDYVYVTGAVTNIGTGKGVAARFYVVKNGQTYYANYTGTPYYGICSPEPNALQ